MQIPKSIGSSIGPMQEPNLPYPEISNPCSPSGASLLLLRLYNNNCRAILRLCSATRRFFIALLEVRLLYQASSY